MYRYFSFRLKWICSLQTKQKKVSGRFSCFYSFPSESIVSLSRSWFSVSWAIIFIVIYIFFIVEFCVYFGLYFELNGNVVEHFVNFYDLSDSFDKCSDTFYNSTICLQQFRRWIYNWVSFLMGFFCIFWSESGTFLLELYKYSRYFPGYLISELCSKSYLRD